MTGAAQTRVLLIDDHALFRESVSLVLAGRQEFEMSHCGSIRESLEILLESEVDVVLLDHDLGSERASQFLPAARQLGFAGPVLVVTAWVSDHEARRLIRQGVAGIFLKEKPLDVLAETIRCVVRGEPLPESGPDPTVVPAEKEAAPRLNDRQQKVLQYVVEGLSNKEIAWRLQISESYVKAIVQRLFHKTGVRTRGQLVRIALEQTQD